MPKSTVKYDITLKKKIFKNICEFLQTKDGLKSKRKDLIKKLTGDFSLAAVDFVIQELVAKGTFCQSFFFFFSLPKCWERLVVCGKSRTEVLRLRKKDITASLKKLPREDRSVYAAIENTEAKGKFHRIFCRNWNFCIAMKKKGSRRLFFGKEMNGGFILCLKLCFSKCTVV